MSHKDGVRLCLGIRPVSVNKDHGMRVYGQTLMDGDMRIDFDTVNFVGCHFVGVTISKLPTTNQRIFYRCSFIKCPDETVNLIAAHESAAYGCVFTSSMSGALPLLSYAASLADD